MKNVVSICIPAYNQELFIEETLQSCLDQTYRPLEIVMLDDQSTDRTYELALNLAAKNNGDLNVTKNVLLRIERNLIRKGLEGNWNTVVNLAAGEFIKVLCGDDLLDSTCIQEQTALMLANPDLTMVSCQRRIINTTGETLLTSNGKHFAKPTEFVEGLNLNWLSGTNLIGEPLCVLFRKSDFEKTKGFDGSLPYMIDLSLWVQLWQLGKLIRTQSVLGAFRIHANSLTAQLKTKQFFEYVSFMDKSPIRISKWTYTIATILAFTKCIARNLFFIWAFLALKWRTCNKPQKRTL